MLDRFNNFRNRCACYSSVIFYLISISVDFPLPVISSTVAVLFWVVFFYLLDCFQNADSLRPLCSRQNLMGYYRDGVICQTFYCRHPVSGA